MKAIKTDRWIEEGGKLIKSGRIIIPAAAFEHGIKAVMRNLTKAGDNPELITDYPLTEKAEGVLVGGDFAITTEAILKEDIAQYEVGEVVGFWEGISGGPKVKFGNKIVNCSFYHINKVKIIK